MPLGPGERAALGKAARAAAPRSSHGAWRPADDRPDSVALLESQSADRVAGLVPIRHGRMVGSPLAYFRGAALVMASDLAGSPTSGLTVQLCGDAHLSNFGLFGSPERRLMFDVNDFDETLPGPWEWDLKRLVASFEVLGREAGFDRADRRAVVRTVAREYRDHMRRAARARTLDVWYAHLDEDRVRSILREERRRNRLGEGELRAGERRLAEARARDSVRVLAKRAREADGELRIVADPPLIVPLEDVRQAGTEWDDAERLIERLLRSYRRTLSGHHHPVEDFRYVHVARKVVGVGSVGTRCYIMLLIGRDRRDPLFLQVKEANESVLERYLGASRYRNHGQRVVAGQTLMQAASDIFLGWQRIKGLDGISRDYYVRQFHDWKGGAEVEQLRVRSAHVYGLLCASTLARAHARSGDRIAIASYLGSGDAFDRAMVAFAESYADQNDRDFEAFSDAVRTGRLEADPDG